MKISIGSSQSSQRQGARILLEAIRLSGIDINPIIQRLNSQEEIEMLGKELGCLIKNHVEELKWEIRRLDGMWKSEEAAHHLTLETLRQKEKDLLSNRFRKELRKVRLELENEKMQKETLQSRVDTLEQEVEEEKQYWEDIVQQMDAEIADLNRVIADRYLNLRTQDGAG